MKPFTHFILTRFNVPVPSAAAGAGAARKGLDAGWLARRFDLFERVCLPSVDRQTEGAVQWLVFMDWATPVAFKERMAALAVHNDCLRPVYCSQFDEEAALAEIRRREGADGVRITTSLDSDDALHSRMVENIQELARAHLGSLDLKRGFLVSFPVGCVQRQGDFYVRCERRNPFVSFVSAPECARTVLAAGSPALAEAVPMLAWHRRPMWCQTVHADNADVAVRGIYWPWGGESEFAAGVVDGLRRPAAWRCAEVVRSAIRFAAGR